MFQAVVLFFFVCFVLFFYFASDNIQWSPHISVTPSCCFLDIVTLSTDGGQDNHVTSAELFYHPPTQWLCTEGCSEIYNKACRQCPLHSRTYACRLGVTWKLRVDQVNF